MSCYVSVIIPVFNEEKRLPVTLRHVVDFLKSQPYSSEVLVVDGGSRDGRKAISESFIQEFPSLRIIEEGKRMGKGHAVKMGMLSAGGEYCLFMDADYAVPIEYLSEFLSLIKKEGGIIVGSRALEGSILEQRQSFIREGLARSFGILQKFILQLPVFDTQCGFKLLKGENVKQLFSKMVYDCAYFDAELLYIAHHYGIPIKEVPVRWKHDGETRLPIGVGRSVDLLIKLFRIKKIHSKSVHKIQMKLPTRSTKKAPI